MCAERKPKTLYMRLLCLFSCVSTKTEERQTLIQVKRENDKIDLGLNWKIFHFVFTCPRTIWHDLSQTIMETFVA